MRQYIGGVSGRDTRALKLAAKVLEQAIESPIERLLIQSRGPRDLRHAAVLFETQTKQQPVRGRELANDLVNEPRCAKRYVPRFCSIDAIVRTAGRSGDLVDRFDFGLPPAYAGRQAGSHRFDFRP